MDYILQLYKNYLDNFENKKNRLSIELIFDDGCRPYYKVFDKIKALEFIPKLDTIIDHHPEYQYPSYFKAKILLKLGDLDQMLAALIPFAKKKKNDFWVWETLAEGFVED